MTDGLNAVWSNDRAAHTDTNPKNLELAPHSSHLTPHARDYILLTLITTYYSRS